MFDFFSIVGKKLGWSLNQEAITSMTRGYVGDTQFAVLPTIEALHTMIITVVVQLVGSIFFFSFFFFDIMYLFHR